ncbi:MAG TPA: translation initiation factor IF-2 [Sphingobium sp.]|uniref:translation initiation factor IF-2 n=1 Tax=Sphingobium sp. TaxID=1912891 RepID=UPI002ED528AE
MSDNNGDKPVLGRKPLGLKRTVEAGQVQQSFSHGRKNTVVVEVKRRRQFGKPGEGEPLAPAAVEAEPVAPEPVAAPPPPPRPQPVAERPVSRPAPAAPNDSLMSRQERQAKLLREAEEARMASLEDARRRQDAERLAASEEEKRRAEEAEARRKAETEAEVAVEQTETAKVADAASAIEAETTDAPQTPVAEVPAAAAPAAGAEEMAAAAPAAATPAPAPRRFTPVAPVKRPEPKVERPKRGPGAAGDDRRQAGKLTVTRALTDDDSARARSLAALKRAREKEYRRTHSGGPAQPREKQVRDVVVPEAITVAELANRMAEKGADLVKSLFKMGTPVTQNDVIDQDTAELLVEEFGHRIQRVSDADVEIDSSGDVDAEETLLPRPPVVTIMGHVDHGKTSLLDALRGTDVVRGEAGGITQHIGAYQVKTKGGDLITFLDTPGHEAFTDMRARGANVTDIVILVVAADDGLMPQTIEAINHTKAAGVPMIVAINKIDKHEANPQRVRERLLEHDIQVEEMGGDTQDVEVSALKKIGLDTLIEKILLQAELLELRANPDRPAEGTVVEAQLDKGRGPVATILVGRGTLKVGDTFVVGAESGKVRAMVNDKGQQVKVAGPSTPVEVLGLTGVPRAGDQMSVVENEARAREVAAYRQELALRKRTTAAPTSFEHMFSALNTTQMEYPIVIKGDVQGSVEAIVNALNRISTDEIKVRVLHSGVGAITESDVTLAAASRAPLIGFNVRPNAKARPLAVRDKVSLRYYDVIYDLLEEVRNEMAGQLGPERIETVVGRAEVREVFPAGKKDKAAGLLVVDGVIRKGFNARLTRQDVIVSKTVIASLRRFKDDVAEVRAGLECGVMLQDTNDIKAGDMLELFEVEERARVL